MRNTDIHDEPTRITIAKSRMEGTRNIIGNYKYVLAGVQ